MLVVNETEAAQLGAAITGAVARCRHHPRRAGRHPARCSDGLRLRSEPPAVEVVDTTGAGDAFAGTLAASWRLGREAALVRACAAGALATTRAGAGSAPTRAEVDAALGQQ